MATYVLKSHQACDERINSWKEIEIGIALPLSREPVDHTLAIGTDKDRYT